MLTKKASADTYVTGLGGGYQGWGGGVTTTTGIVLFPDTLIGGFVMTGVTVTGGMYGGIHVAGSG